MQRSQQAELAGTRKRQLDEDEERGLAVQHLPGEDHGYEPIELKHT
jgi:hypothetical protein